MARTTKLGDNDTAVGSVVVDVCGRHPHAGYPRAVPLLDVVRLQSKDNGQTQFLPPAQLPVLEAPGRL